MAEAPVFAGRLPAAKVRQFHALLDVFVVPRTPDRVCQLVTPLKPVEAMASGLCVVTSEVKALTEIVKHEVTGMQTVPQDPVSLADCLEYLLYSPDIRRKLGDNAREWAARARARGFRATSDEAEIGPQDVIVICVPTPLSTADGPDLGAVRAAAETAGRLLRPRTLVSLESTTYPGTTDEVVRPLLEKGSGLTAGIDFSLVFSPERIDPGNPEYGLVNTPKIVGGVTPSCADAAIAFYEAICEQVVRAASAREAEMAKLLENTYRHVNIALVNEMAIFCRELGVDLHDAIRCAATKPFGFAPFYPGPGVGGHCIPIDPNYLSYKVRTLGYPFRFVELAQEVNGRMPGYVVSRATELLNRNYKPVNGPSVLLLGVTYKKDIADQRESPARPIARKLRARGAAVAYHDPYVPAWQVDGQDVPRASGLA